MKNLYTKTEFLSERSKILNDLQLNEGFFGNLFGKFWNYLKGIKGGKDVKNIYDKYVKIINDEFKKKGKNIQLDLSDAKPVENKPAKPVENQQQANQPAGNQPVQKQNASYSFEELNEAGGVMDAVKGAVAGAKAGFKGEQSGNQPAGNQPTDKQPNQQQANTNQQGNQDKKSKKYDKAEHENLMKIVNLHKNQAQKEMNAVLKKYGGEAQNPKLAASIGAFMYNFDIALTRAELKEYPNDKQVKMKLDQQEKEYNQKVTAISKGTTQDAAVIDIAGKKMKLNTPYQYNSGGGSKTIMVTGKDKDPQKVRAKYVSDKMGQTIEQPFRANLIKTDFVPVVNQKYRYFSTKRNDIIDVEVLGQPDKRGLVKVKTDTGNIMVHTGALMNPKKEKQAPAEQAAPVQKAAPVQQTAAPAKEKKQ